MDLKEAFKVRPTNSEMTEFTITIGNELATEERFDSIEKAQAELDKTNWNLVGAIAHKLVQIAVEELTTELTKEKEVPNVNN